MSYVQGLNETVEIFNSDIADVSLLLSFLFLENRDLYSTYIYAQIENYSALKKLHFFKQIYRVT